jgi:hypothetical protein
MHGHQAEIERNFEQNPDLEPQNQDRTNEIMCETQDTLTKKASENDFHGCTPTWVAEDACHSQQSPTFHSHFARGEVFQDKYHHSYCPELGETFGSYLVLGQKACHPSFSNTLGAI